jgi:hypothetical protein
MAQGLDSQDYTRLVLINTSQYELAHLPRPQPTCGGALWAALRGDPRFQHADQQDTARAPGRRVCHRLPWRDHLAP